MAEASYWNHNSAYHPWLLDIVRAHGRCDVLDVGCGDGLLAQRLAPLARSVTAIDPDDSAVQRTLVRVATASNVVVHQTSFEEFDAGFARYDLITFVAALHHMDLASSLTKARQLLRPGGTIAVVGLSANHTISDWVVSALCLPVVKLAGVWHREVRDIGVVVAEPRQHLGEIRRTARHILPGVAVRRGVYYRYLLRFTSGRAG